MTDINLTLVMQNSFVYIISIVIFAWLATYFPIRPVLKSLHYKNVGPAPWEARSGDWLGFLERTLYIIIIGKGIFVFVPIWLAFKVSVSWKGWGEGIPKYHLNAFLIGSALSLIMGIIGAFFTQAFYAVIF